MSQKIKWIADFEKSSLVSNFEKRGWQRGTEEDWNFYWANVVSFRALMSPESGIRLSDSQVINHFPNHLELTKKDLMVKHIKRYKKELEKSGKVLDDRLSYLSFLPTTFTLPGDYSMFTEEFRKNPSSIWIMKPTDKARGIGIFIINKLSQVKKWNKEYKPIPFSNSVQRDTYVVSRYIDNPLLIGSKKFDLRMYVLVTSWKPLIAYKYGQGFSRFCTVNYNTDVEDLDNNFMHLTNVSIQKYGEDYNESNGGKWSIKNLLLYLEGTRGKAATDKLVERIDSILIHSLRSVKDIISSERRCFECYGYDIIIDSELFPWLIEVNASPSLSATTASDRLMKHSLINDILNIVIPKDFLEVKTRGIPQIKPADLGDFIPLDAEPEQENGKTSSIRATSAKKQRPMSSRK